MLKTIINRIIVHHSQVELHLSFNEDPKLWDNTQYAEFVKIRICQSTNSEATSILTNNSGLFTTNKYKALVSGEQEIFLKDVEDVKSFTVNFDVPVDSLEHLSYFALLEVDQNALAKAYNFPVTANDYLYGRVVSEVVLDRGETQMRSFALMKDNAVYAGQPYYKSGVFFTSNGEELTLRSVRNLKLQDYRAIRSLRQYFAHYKTKTPNKKNFFSKIGIARDAAGRCRYTFGLDYAALCQQECLFGEYNKIQNDVTISTMSVIRRRVNSETMQPFMLDEIPNRVGILGVRDLEEREYINYTSTNRFFEGIDKEISSVTDGSYQYGVELCLEDGTYEHCRWLYHNLVEAHAAMERYYNDIADTTKEEGDMYQVGKCLQQYLETLYYFTTITRDHARSAYTQLYTLVTPRLATCNSVHSVIELMQELLHELHEFLSHYNPPEPLLLQHWFGNDTFDANTPAHVGYNYLFNSVDAEEDTGLKTVSQEEMVSRSSYEIDKYFTKTNPTISGVEYDFLHNSPSFLSPTSVELGSEGVYDLEAVEDSLLCTLESSILQYQYLPGTLWDRASKEIYYNNMPLANGVSVQCGYTDTTEHITRPDVNKGAWLLFALAMRNSKTTPRLSSWQTPHTYANLPMQIVSLHLRENPLVKKKWTDDTLNGFYRTRPLSSAFRMYYNLLCRCEIMVGIDQWEPLNLEHLKKLRSGEALCRLVEYEYHKLPSEKHLKLPIYNQYFTIFTPTEALIGQGMSSTQNEEELGGFRKELDEEHEATTAQDSILAVDGEVIISSNPTSQVQEEVSAEDIISEDILARVDECLLCQEFAKVELKSQAMDITPVKSQATIAHEAQRATMMAAMKADIKERTNSGEREVSLEEYYAELREEIEYWKDKYETLKSTPTTPGWGNH